MSYDSKPTSAPTAEVAQMLVARDRRLTTAEPCTGGNLVTALCAQADTAAFYNTGVVTFNGGAERNVLQVRAETLGVHNAVNEACVQEISAGILAMADADITIAISGYAGPEGGEDGTPAGVVWFARNSRGQTEAKRMCFAGDRETVVTKAVQHALVALSEKLVHWQ